MNADPSQDQVTQLDFAVDGRLDFDYSATARSGITYGAHFELDLFQSDDDALSMFSQDVRALIPVRPFNSDIATGDTISFNDGYVFIDSALGYLALGDTGVAGKAKNQLKVPILPMGAFEFDEFGWFAENEQVFYGNSFAGIGVEVSTDDDGRFALGVGYEGRVGGVDVELGLSAMRDEMNVGTAGTRQINNLAGSLQVSAGGVTTGVNYASFDVDKWQTIEYVATGASYNMGALTLGLGVETYINHLAFIGGENYVTNLCAGATYELAEGLILGVGIGNLDADNTAGNRQANYVNFAAPGAPRPRATNAIFSAKVEL